jgi:nitrogen regulatory protein PII
MVAKKQQVTMTEIKNAAYTANPGDGKIVLMAVEDAVQIRTDKNGSEAV